MIPKYEAIGIIASAIERSALVATLFRAANPTHAKKLGLDDLKQQTNELLLAIGKQARSADTIERHLKDLEGAGIVSHNPEHEYSLTSEGSQIASELVLP